MFKEGRIFHMKRLFFVGVIVSLLMAVASVSWAETTVEDSKGKSSERMEGSGKSKGKSKSKGTKSTPAPGPQSQQDPCASVKNDPKQYARCKDAATPIGLTERAGRRGRY
jgi:hypothetical protein